MSVLKSWSALVALALLGASILAAVTVDSARAEAVCGEQFAALSAAIVAAEFGGQAEKTEAGLLAKTADAQAKLQQGKTADALLKLADIRASVTALAERGKVTGGPAIIAAVDATTACITGAGTSAA